MVLPTTNNQQPTTVVLRGHHLLCIWGWKGFGYDEKFGKKMDEVHVSLSRYNPRIVVDNRPDDICNSCPNLGPEGCFKDKVLKETEVRAHDKRVLDFLQLKTGSTITADNLKKLISERKPYNILQALCIDCQWLEKNYCHNGLSKTEGWRGGGLPAGAQV